MLQYKYTANWFLTSDIFKNILNFTTPYKKYSILEIGCYEGLSSVFFADNLLNHNESVLICVDPFLSIDNNDHGLSIKNNNVELNFDHNISVCKNNEKVFVHKITSDDFFQTNTKTFNLIYIDGCHECDYIIRDMKNSFKYLEPNGIMWMDDYLGGPEGDHRIKNTMDKFLDDYNGQYELIYSGYQLAIRKI
jgi:predicted O-methyltransferase YrrM